MGYCVPLFLLGHNALRARSKSQPWDRTSEIKIELDVACYEAVGIRPYRRDYWAENGQQRIDFGRQYNNALGHPYSEADGLKT